MEEKPVYTWAPSPWYLKNMAAGKHNKEQIALLLAEHPTMRAAELARRVGCSYETARKHKKKILATISATDK
jgi:DNA-binding CsgD family transcriptional regulator